MYNQLRTKPVLVSGTYLRVPYIHSTSMDFYLYLHVPEGVPVRKKYEILD